VSMPGQVQPAVDPVQGDDEPEGPVLIEARDLEKLFRIPEHRIDTFKERALHPFSGPDFRELRALDKVSFDVRKGEFFGIVGRNGSGKSTLLKILASIYRADAGTIRVAGRLAPFIELGVGFNPELTARDNVVLNAVMMGLTPRQARQRLPAVFEFAELEDFTELKLKNYSSGMSVRLAFSVMLQTEADILLIDEVLAVGDAAFQQKCYDVFHEMKDADKTVVFVTHDMTAVQTFCDRAMLLHDGQVTDIGEPEEIGRHYLRLNFEGEHAGKTDQGENLAVDLHTAIIEARLLDEDDDPITNIEFGRPIRFEAVLEAKSELLEPVLTFHVLDADSRLVFGHQRALVLGNGEPGHVPAGGRIQIAGTLDNPLNPGRYHLTCWVRRNRTQGDMAVQAMRMIDFVVFGTPGGAGGMITVDGDIELELEGSR